MIEGLKGYAENKESGLHWLGQVPRHWEVIPTRHLFRQVVRQDFNGDEPKMSMSRHYGLVRSDTLAGRAASAATSVAFSVCHRGDLVMNKYQAWNGLFGCATERGLITANYSVFKPAKNAASDYYALLYASAVYRTLFRLQCRGVGDGMMPLYTSQFGRVPSIAPPPSEQAAIVRFLDFANRKIDEFIRVKRKLIGLLNERKQAIIHRAVTRGLHPDVPLKPSGIPWLGDIPQHWETIRCGNLFREVVDVGHPEATLLSIDRFKGIIPQADTGRKTRASKDRSVYKRVRPGQLAYNLMNAFMGALGFSDHDGIVSPAYAVARPLREIETRYYHDLLRTTAYTGEYNRLSYGIMYERNRLYFERFKLVRALFPPLNEQRQIADWIEIETRSLNLAIARTDREIALMQEYRTRLTADIVTGKLDVREAAAKLPDTSAEPAAEEALEEMLEESEREEAEV